MFTIFKKRFMNILEVLKMMSEYGFFKFHEKLRKIYLIQLKEAKI